MHDFLLGLIIYYCVGFLFTIWNMKRLDRKLDELADEAVVDRLPGGRKLICFALAIAIFCWPIGVVDPLRRP